MGRRLILQWLNEGVVSMSKAKITEITDDKNTQVVLTYTCGKCQGWGEYVADKNLSKQEIMNNFSEYHLPECLKRAAYAKQVSNELCAAFIKASEV